MQVLRSDDAVLGMNGCAQLHGFRISIMQVLGFYAES